MACPVRVPPSHSLLPPQHHTYSRTMKAQLAAAAPTHAPRMSPARLCVRQFCTSAWSRLILRPLKPQNSVQPCPCHHTICDESWPVCAKPPLPAPVPHAADHTHTHTCSCPHLHPSRPSSAATFSPCPCFPSRPQPTTHSYALTSPYLPSPLPPFPLQATSCKAPPQHARRHRMRGAQLPGGLCTTDQRPPSLVVITLTADPPYNAI